MHREVRAQGPYRTLATRAPRSEERDHAGVALIAVLLGSFAIPIGAGLGRASFGALETASFAAAVGLVLVLMRDVRAREWGERERMLDIVYVALTVGFFAASVGLVWLFDRL